MTEPNLTPGNLAEQAGAEEAFKALEAIDAAADQAQRLGILIDVISHLSESTCKDRAIAGFCCVLIARLDRISQLKA